ncbi:hypothetical protein IWX91DRAFT_325963 [Phyllosticta citricarpa]
MNPRKRFKAAAPMRKQTRSSASSSSSDERKDYPKTSDSKASGDSLPSLDSLTAFGLSGRPGMHATVEQVQECMRQLRKAHRTLSQIWHPDTCRYRGVLERWQCEEMYRLVQEKKALAEYDCLNLEMKARAWDRERRADREMEDEGLVSLSRVPFAMNLLVPASMDGEKDLCHHHHRRFSPSSSSPQVLVRHFSPRLYLAPPFMVVNSNSAVDRVCGSGKKDAIDQEDEVEIAAADRGQQLSSRPTEKLQNDMGAGGLDTPPQTTHYNAERHVPPLFSNGDHQRATMACFPGSLPCFESHGASTCIPFSMTLSVVDLRLTKGY